MKNFVQFFAVVFVITAIMLLSRICVAKALTTEEIINDFLQTAFNKFHWEDSFVPLPESFAGTWVAWEPANLTKEAELKRQKGRRGDVDYIIERPQGVPRTDRLAKFKDNQRVQVLFAGNMSPLHRQLFDEHFSQLSKATGLKFKTVSSYDSSTQDGLIQINVEVFFANNFFKRITGLTTNFNVRNPKWHPDDDCDIFKLRYRYYKGAIEFTPEMRSQVDGFLILNDDGSIKRAKCHIWRLHEEEMLRSLVDECLVRALGLPDVSHLAENTVVGQWNTSHEPYSSLYRLDKENYITHHGGIINGDFPEEDKGQFPPGPILDNPKWWRSEIQRRATESGVSLPQISEYDLLLLKILYNPALRIGMTQDEVRQVLPQVVFEARSSKNN